MNILLIEDGDGQQEVRSAILEMEPSPALHAVRNGEQAQEYLREAHEPPVLALIAGAPPRTAVEDLRVLRSDAHGRGVPVAVLCTDRQERDMIESHGFGVSGYVLRNVAGDGLTQAVESILFHWLSKNET